MKQLDLSDVSEENLVEHLKKHNLECALEGVNLGWWASVDERGNPVPHTKVFFVEDFHNKATMANIAAEAGAFPSVNIARKNGFNRPIELGLHVFKRKKLGDIRVEIKRKMENI